MVIIFHCYRIQHLWETGLMNHWIKNNIPLKELVNVEKCLKKEKDSAHQKPIKLVDFTSAFFVLTIGAGLALVFFLFELFYFKCQSAKIRNRLDRHNRQV